jgi:hypothetical protein
MSATYEYSSKNVFDAEDDDEADDAKRTAPRFRKPRNRNDDDKPIIETTKIALDRSCIDDRDESRSGASSAFASLLAMQSNTQHAF